MRMMNEYAEVNNKEITIIMEKATRSDKVKVWGCLRDKEGKISSNFMRYFENIEKASIFYNNQINKAMSMYLAKCTDM